MAMNPLMPKGVEHSMNVAVGASHVSAMNPLMPKGVEHLNRAAIAFSLGARDEPSDAERRWGNFGDTLLNGFRCAACQEEVAESDAAADDGLVTLLAVHL